MNDPKSILEPIAGYALDVLSKLRGRPFVPHSLTKLQNLKVCRDLTMATTAIEVGSFKGVTKRRLCYLFERVISIEIDPTLHEQAKFRCAARKNVELLLGDGAQLLPTVVSRTSNALLFSDGHYSEGQTGQGEEPEPVLKEMELLNAHLSRISATINDDFRLFGVEDGWPRKSEVMAKIERVFPSGKWTHNILNDQCLVLRKAVS
jgi:hypothetical protein